MKHMNRHGVAIRKIRNNGFTLLELLMVALVMGIVGLFALQGVQGYLASAQLGQAQQNLAQALNRARSESRRTSTDQTISWVQSTKTFSIGGKNIVLPNNVSIDAPTDGSFLYTAPFGRITKTDFTAIADIQFVLSSMGTSKKIRIQGITGRVVRVVSN